MDYILTFHDEDKDRIESNFALYHSYQETLLGDEGNPIPNPQTKAQFIIEKSTQFILDSVLASEVKIAVDQAREEVINGQIKAQIIK